MLVRVMVQTVGALLHVVGHVADLHAVTEPHVGAFQAAQHGGHLGAGGGRELVHAFEIGAVGLEPQRLVDHARELVGARGAQQHTRRARVGRHLPHHEIAACGVRVDHIMVVAPAFGDHLAHLVLVGPAGGEQSADLREQLRRHLIGAVLRQVVHQVGDQAWILLRHVIQHAFEVRGDEDVHRRRDRLVERAVAVVGAGRQEVEQHVVLVGGHDELAYRQAKHLRVVAGEHIAEIAGRHHEVDLVAHIDHLLFEQLRVRREIVDDLRHQAAHVDRVRRREHHMVVRGEAFGELLVAEDLLDRGLRIVEIAVDGAHMHIGAGLRGHLQLLHAAHPALRVEHGDAGARGVGEPGQCGLARVARSGGHDHDLLVRVAVGRRGAGHEARQDLQRHILERACGAVEQFHHIVVAERLDRGDALIGPLAAVRLGDALLQLVLAEVGQQHAEHVERDLLVRLAGERGDVDRGLAELIGHKKAAVVGDALADGLLGGERVGAAARAVESSHFANGPYRTRSVPDCLRSPV